MPASNISQGGAVLKRLLALPILALAALILAACGSQAREPSPAPATATPPPLTPVAIDAGVPQPQHTLEETEYRWRQLLPRDSIRPIYEPRFASAAAAPYAPDELVIGVTINGESKAYAVGPLNSREMVNDTLGGVPILVSW